MSQFWSLANSFHKCTGAFQLLSMLIHFSPKHKDIDITAPILETRKLRLRKKLIQGQTQDSKLDPSEVSAGHTKPELDSSIALAGHLRRGHCGLHKLLPHLLGDLISQGGWTGY